MVKKPITTASPYPKLSVREFWRTLWSNADPRLKHTPAVLVDAKQREEVLWLLERRIEDIDRCKKDHWLFAYTTLAALAALCFSLISQPGWMYPVFGWIAVLVAALLWLVWAAMHAATTSALRSARNSKSMSYALLGDHMIGALASSGGIKYVPVVIAFTVTAVAFMTVSAGVAVGGGWLRKPPIPTTTTVHCDIVPPSPARVNEGYLGHQTIGATREGTQCHGSNRNCQTPLPK